LESKNENLRFKIFNRLLARSNESRAILYTIVLIVLIGPVALTAFLLSVYDVTAQHCPPSAEATTADCAAPGYMALTVLSVLCVFLLLWGVRFIERMSALLYPPPPTAKEGGQVVFLPSPGKQEKPPRIAKRRS
jgi:hypothetical protein